jgi:crotonobetainyl-CoA:carnitine CoA-transferase CaiB-like acyl-CoA transferase
VIKVEEPRGGDFMRTIGPFTDEGYSMWWAVEGRGRRGVTLDLRGPDGQDLFRRLTATADVVCENFRPGTMEGWHIGPDDCDPRLVWARISVFGQDGPYSPRPGLDRLGIAYGGLLNITGYPDRPPVRPGVTISDYLTGVFAAEAVIAALYRRDRPGGGTGRGGVEWTIAGQDRLGITRQREGNRMRNSAPLDNYPTADGRYVCIVAGSDANFRRLCAAMGRPDLAEDPRWSTLAKRAAGSDEINGIVTEWASSLTAAQIEERCIEHGVPVGTAYDAAEILADPHIAARGDLVTVDDPIAGPHRQQAPFPRLDGARPVAPAPAPSLGEHNAEVWCDLVGLTADELGAHRKAGVI